MDPQPAILPDLRKIVANHTAAVVTAKNESPDTAEAMGPLAICSLLCASMHVQIECTEALLTELRRHGNA